MQQINPEQLSVVQRVAAIYWHKDAEDVRHYLNKIKIIKWNAGKVSGYLPGFGEYPPVFIKVYFYDRGYQNEIAGLTAASVLQPHHNIVVPRILKIMPESRAILLEKNKWRDSSSKFSRFFISAININWHYLGSWLRNFHDHNVEFRKNDYFIRKKVNKIRFLQGQLSKLFSDSQLNKIDSIILSGQNHLHVRLNEWVLSHGDFGLDNIKYSSSGINIIDFEDTQIAPREFDVLNFVIRLENTSYISQQFKSYQKTCDEFLTGYGRILNDSPLTNFLILLIRLDIIETYYRRRKEKLESVYNKFIYYYFQNESLKHFNHWLATVN